MKRTVVVLSCCGLCLALMGDVAAPADPQPAKDTAATAKDTADSQKPKDSEKPKDAEKAKDAKDAKESPEAAAGKPATQVVKKGPFKIEVTLDGTFEAQTMTEIVLRPDEWAGLTVLSAVEHGAPVNRNDLLVALDLEKIDRAIADLRAEQQIGALTLKQAEQQLRSLETSTPLDLATAQRAQKGAGDDLKFYIDTGRTMSVKMAEFMLKMAQQSLEYQQEELRQLEKMYKADDITEETEEIVLKRARNGVERAKFSLEAAKTDYEQTMKFQIPRAEDKIRETAQRTALDCEKAQVTLPAALQKQRLDLEKAKIAQARGEEKLRKLEADRVAMTIKAPVNGVVYYGRCVRGKWTAGLATEGLRRGGTLTPNEVVMTIVQPRPMFVRAALSESQVHRVRAGIKGTAEPTGYPEQKLTVIVERVAAVPSGGTFDTRISVALDQKSEALMPGMTCDVKLLAYQAKDAIAVPAGAVATDELDQQKHYVYVAGKDGKPKKQEVRLGQRGDKQVEILQGLGEGDEILLSPPKEAK